jgi:hypothetical protein
MSERASSFNLFEDPQERRGRQQVLCRTFMGSNGGTGGYFSMADLLHPVVTPPPTDPLQSNTLILRTIMRPLASRPSAMSTLSTYDRGSLSPDFLPSEIPSPNQDALVSAKTRISVHPPHASPSAR